jgi:hypothetical protein
MVAECNVQQRRVLDVGCTSSHNHSSPRTVVRQRNRPVKWLTGIPLPRDPQGVGNCGNSAIPDPCVHHAGRLGGLNMVTLIDATPRHQRCIVHYASLPTHQIGRPLLICQAESTKPAMPAVQAGRDHGGLTMASHRPRPVRPSWGNWTRLRPTAATPLGRGGVVLTGDHAEVPEFAITEGRSPLLAWAFGRTASTNAKRSLNG